MSVSESGRSVGSAIAGGAAFSVDHPEYRALIDAVSQRVSAITEEKSAARLAAEPVLVTVLLDVGELSGLSSDYPEFAVINYGHYRPGHAAFVQADRLANEWVSLQARRLTESIAHLGASPLSYLTGPLNTAQLICDPCNPVAVHERHALTVDAYRVFSEYIGVGKEMGRELSREKYEKYLAGDAFPAVTPPKRLAQADVICVDLALHPMAPQQLAGIMMEADAQVAFGFLMYTPQMLLEESGDLANTGVRFVKTDVGIDFQYPEGPAAAVHYDYAQWEPWLIAHTFRVGSVPGQARWFQVELLKNRGPFMFFRMAALPYGPSDDRIVHALDTGLTGDMLLVSVPELVSLTADPTRKASWQTVRFLAPKRVIQRTYEHCMQLPRDQFTRYAVRKYVQRTNDRITVNGTSVKVNARLGVLAVTRLVVAVYSRAFEDRYRAGQLTQEIMNHVKSVTRGRAVSTYAAVVSQWSGLSGIVAFVDRAVRTVAEKIDSIRTPVDTLGDFTESPSYVLVGEALRLSPQVLRSRGFDAFVEAYAATIKPVPTLPGSLIAAACSQAANTADRALAGWSRYLFRTKKVPLFTPGETSDDAMAAFSAVSAVNEVDEPRVGRYDLEVEQVVRQIREERAQDFEPDPDPVGTLNEFYRAVNPGVPLQDLEYDTASISLDPQDRVLAAEHLRLPGWFGEPPRPRQLYRSNLMALNVPRRQSTLHELLSAASARNMSAPQVALPQDDNAAVQDVWETFLDVACVEDARELLRSYQLDSVGLAEEAFGAWSRQVPPDRLKSVRESLEAVSASMGDMDVSDYLVMLKSDVKPDLTTKPIESRMEPQVIVYHVRELNALYSSVFRVIVRRFLALLRPNYHVNLLKDIQDIEAFIRGVHPFGADVKYLENDFSKYDKSQGKFVFMLEEFVFGQLGMNSDLLDKWAQGHVECTMRSLSLGLSLTTLYQRKSGDATTSFGNVLLNVLSVTYAYRGTSVAWAVFMGDDSLVCAWEVARVDTAVTILAEVFNLGAKTYLTEAPYFASNFILLGSEYGSVACVPDPVKRVARWSMAIPADDPQWNERYISARDSMAVYLNCFNTAGLERAVSLRYPVGMHEAAGVAGAVATLVADSRKFRKIWAEMPEMSSY